MPLLLLQKFGETDGIGANDAGDPTPLVGQSAPAIFFTRVKALRENTKPVYVYSEAGGVHAGYQLSPGDEIDIPASVVADAQDILLSADKPDTGEPGQMVCWMRA